MFCRWKKACTRWLSEHWTTRSGHLFLLPGDSAIGFRLPLNSLPYVPPQARTLCRRPILSRPAAAGAARQKRPDYTARNGMTATDIATGARALPRHQPGDHRIGRRAGGAHRLDGGAARGTALRVHAARAAAADYFTLLSAVEEPPNSLGLRACRRLSAALSIRASMSSR
jgi:uncharacterized protein (DUF2126 family)